MPKPKSQYPAESEEANSTELDPLLDAMLNHLPPSGSPFPAEPRALWMQIWELALKLIYPEDHAAEPSA